MATASSELTQPNNKVGRSVLKWLIRVALTGLGDIKIVGKENLPSSGPLLVVGNHFSFLDPLAVIHVVPWQLEFIAGAQAPNAPKALGWIRNLWHTIPVNRGTASREALLHAQTVLKRGGVLGIFPEGGSWATVLRPPRPGAAFLAARANAPILPIGIDGLDRFFKNFRLGKRAPVTLRIGKPFGPYHLDRHKGNPREQLDQVGHEIMQHIAELLPENQRGFYSSDPAIREAAKGTEIYPWEGVIEE
jgi:1-acyl-sn-glycerol-3-phosphate acyltransferase